MILRNVLDLVLLLLSPFVSCKTARHTNGILSSAPDKIPTKSLSLKTGLVHNELNGVHEESISTAKMWQVRAALMNSTKFKDGNCITVGFNLHQKDLIYFRSLDSQLIYIESGNIPDLRKMMYHSWCVR